jgi:hypothetical protein
MSPLLGFGFLLVMQAVPAIDSTSEWALAAETRFGSIDVPETALSRIRAAAVDSEGRLFLAQLHDKRIRIYDLNGVRVGSIGRPGNGPQDLEAPVDVGIAGDTIWVADRKAASLKFFGLDGGYRGSVTIAHVAGPGIFATAGYPLEDGTVLTKPGVAMESLVDAARQVPWIRFDREAQPIDTLLLQHRSFSFARVESNGQTMFVQQLFDESDLVAVSPDGSGIVHVVQSGAGSSPRISISKVAADGATMFAREYSTRRRELTEQLVDRSVDRYMEALEKEMASSFAFDARRFRNAYAGALRRPEFIPPVADVRLGSDGTIWIGREAVGGDSRQWVAVDGANGDPLGHIQLPHDSRLIASSAEFVWAEELDELDVVHVQRYRIMRP